MSYILGTLQTQCCSLKYFQANSPSSSDKAVQRFIHIASKLSSILVSSHLQLLGGKHISSLNFSSFCLFIIYLYICIYYLCIIHQYLLIYYLNYLSIYPLTYLSSIYLLIIYQSHLFICYYIYLSSVYLSVCLSIYHNHSHPPKSRTKKQQVNTFATTQFLVYLKFITIHFLGEFIC